MVVKAEGNLRLALCANLSWILFLSLASSTPNQQSRWATVRGRPRLRLHVLESGFSNLVIARQSWQYGAADQGQPKTCLYIKTPTL